MSAGEKQIANSLQQDGALVKDIQILHNMDGQFFVFIRGHKN
jgi:hypothetical protein